MNILIQGGRVLDPASGLDAVADVAIHDGVVQHIGALPSDFVPDTTLAAQAVWCCRAWLICRCACANPGMNTKACCAASWLPPWPAG